MVSGEQFANDLLTDVVAEWHLAKGTRIFSTADRAGIDNGLAQLEAARPGQIDILEDWFAREQAIGKYRSLYGSAYRINDLEVDDYTDHIEHVHGWVNAAPAFWANLKRLALIKEAIEFNTR